MQGPSWWSLRDIRQTEAAGRASRGQLHTTTPKAMSHYKEETVRARWFGYNLRVAMAAAYGAKNL